MSDQNVWTAVYVGDLKELAESLLALADLAKRLEDENYYLASAKVWKIVDAQVDKMPDDFELVFNAVEAPQEGIALPLDTRPSAPTAEQEVEEGDEDLHL